MWLESGGGVAQAATNVNVQTTAVAFAVAKCGSLRCLAHGTSIAISTAFNHSI